MLLMNSIVTAALSRDFDNVIESLVRLKTDLGLGDLRSPHTRKIALSL